MFLTKNSKSNYKVIWKSGNLVAEYASQELQKYVRLISGADLEITESSTVFSGNFFHIGLIKDANQQAQLEKADLNGDGFILEVTKNEIYLNAKTNRGLIFGVYRILEEYFGVRFFNMDCEKIPSIKDMELPETTIIEAPTFAMRSYLNGKMLSGKGEEFDIYHLKNKMCNEHRHLPERLGGECPMFGRGGTHNMSRYVPKEKYMESHPEFYMIGDRFSTIDLLNGITDDAKLDQSMDVSVAKVVIEELKKEIIANPTAVYFQFEQEDGGDEYIVYEQGSKKAQLLEKYGRSGVLVRFCNVIATELKKWADEELNGRKIYLVTFAYSYSKDPPVYEKDGKIYPIDETVVPCENLVIRMALFSNAAYDYFHEKQTEINGQIKGWSAICNKFLFWGYDTDFAHYFWYFPSLRNIRNNIDGFKKLGVHYLMFESADTTLVEWQTDIKAYIYGRLMWNKNLNVDELYNEYMENYFGVASDSVKKAMAIMENYSVYLESIYDGYYVDTFKETYRHIDLYSEELFNRILDILNDGEKAINNSDDLNKDLLIKRLTQVKLTFLVMKMNKLNDQVYKGVDLCGIKLYAQVGEMPENKKQTLYNAEMLYGVKVPIVIPEDVKKKVEEFDVYTISDKIVLEN